MVETDELRDRHARCVLHVAVLHMFASESVSAPLPPDAAQRIADATTAILAESRAGGRAALAAADSRHRSRNLSLLAARQARLEHAAEDAMASAREAARGGDLAALRQRLQRFIALTSAMWTVQVAVCEQGPAPAREQDREPVTTTREPVTG